MSKSKQPAVSNANADTVARIADLLKLEIDEEDLAALSEQLRALAALEATELHEVPPVLTMDAAWHD